MNLDPNLTVLGIETSCDETAIAVVRGNGEILAHKIWSQIDTHAEYGGVVPEVSARAHADRIEDLIHSTISQANITLDDLDGIAATAGPGLIGGVIVGVMAAKSIASALNKPFLAVNHLAGHALTARLTDQVAFPYLLLLTSGGHCQLVYASDHDQFELLGTTIDDAVGEAFDKTAKLLSLPYPGGPAVEKAALKGDENRFDLPVPMRGHKSLDFSFSGLKTAVRQAATNIQPLKDQDVSDICAGFQKSVTATLRDRISRALKSYSERQDLPKEPALVVAGGVAANKKIQQLLHTLCEEHGVKFVAPPHHLCTDNAAMIAGAGYYRYCAGQRDELDIDALPNWPVSELA